MFPIWQKVTDTKKKLKKKKFFDHLMISKSEKRSYPKNLRHHALDI